MWNRLTFTILIATALVACVAPAFAKTMQPNEPLQVKNTRQPDSKARMPAAAKDPKAVKPTAAAPVQPLPSPNRKIDKDLLYTANLGTAASVAANLQAGANPNAKSDEGWSAISLAASRNDKESNLIVQFLIAAGADIDMRDPKGETPVMNAITNNNVELVKILIQSGADMHSVNAMGRDVRAFAEYFGNPDMIKLVNDAIEEEEAKIRDGRSRRRFYRILDDFIFYNCVQQYISYNQQTKFYKGDVEIERAAQLAQIAADKIRSSHVELEQNFRLPVAHSVSIAQNTQVMMFDELEAMISNRNRRAKGIGTDKDLDSRCTSILNVWRSNFEGYETEKSREEIAKKENDAPKEEDGRAVFIAPTTGPSVRKQEEPEPDIKLLAPAVLPDSMKAPPPPE